MPHTPEAAEQHRANAAMFGGHCLLAIYSSERLAQQLDRATTTAERARLRTRLRNMISTAVTNARIAYECANAALIAEGRPDVSIEVLRDGGKATLKVRGR